MTTEAEPTLAGVFPPASEEQWLALVDKVLKGAPLSSLEHRTPGRLLVSPLYCRDGSPGGIDEAGRPGAEPFVRGSRPAGADSGGWGVRTVVADADPHDANRSALRELERGASELTVRFDEAFRSGVGADHARFGELAGRDGVLVTSGDDLAEVLDGVLLDVAPIHLEPGASFVRAAELLAQVWSRVGHPVGALEGGLGADPIGVLAAAGRLPQGLERALADLGALAVRGASEHPGVRSVRVDTTAYVEAGASETEQLACMLSTGAAYLRALADAGTSVDEACSQIEVCLSVDADVFTSIALLRAARRLWASMTGACGASGEHRAPRLHARTASRMLTRRDPWVNLLRVTAGAFAAGVGGADSVTTASFDAALGAPEELGRRMARNTQLLLQQESNVGRVVDPAGGSWYLESLTDAIADAAWEVFVELESAGGLPTVLVDGTLAARLGVSRSDRLVRIATRAEPLTGVTEFPDLHETPVVRTEADLRTLRSRAVNVVAAAGATIADQDATECQPLPRVHWAEQFEALRDASDAYLAATGSRPKVFLVNLGPVAEHTARATYATNFFAAGGIEATTSGTGASSGFDDPSVAVADALAASAHLVCLCSSDRRYAEQAPSFAVALREAGLGPVYLAGHPRDRRDELTAAGVAEFVHVGVDVLDVLRRAHHHVGTPSGRTIR